jgi:ubiquinol-cytochrome c reductase iron-sulfur subunit
VAISQTDETTRRDFLYVATGGAAAVGTAFALWPFIDQMNPSAAVLALASTEIDLTAIQPGQSVTVMWRGKPTFIRRRTPQEIQTAAAVQIDQLIDENARNPNVGADAPATDRNRATRPEWLIVIGVCTHLGCIPLAFQGDYRGWLCPCHGSQYDTAGRVRVGPAPQNLDVPPYTFVSDTRVRIG